MMPALAALDALVVDAVGLVSARAIFAPVGAMLAVPRAVVVIVDGTRHGWHRHHGQRNGE
jgi:hypothetical protein